MWIHKVVLEACPICSKETTLAGVEPHPTHPETGSIHIDAWIADWSKPGQFVHGRVDCCERAV
jgi:hypothetical protein